MFTGIIQTIGQSIGSIIYPNQSIRLFVQMTNAFLEDVKIGDSIAIQGACMTVCEKLNIAQALEQLNAAENRQTTALFEALKAQPLSTHQEITVASFDVSIESLSKIVDFKKHSHFNLEKALRLSDFIGGHLVSGHVDGQARIQAINASSEGWWMQVAIPQEFVAFMMPKGSVTLNGVSLTINRLDDTGDALHEMKGAKEMKSTENLGKCMMIELYLIPHTVAHTTFQYLKAGDMINLEIDLMARYIGRLLKFGQQPSA